MLCLPSCGGPQPQIVKVFVHFNCFYSHPSGGPSRCDEPGWGWWRRRRRRRLGGQQRRCCRNAAARTVAVDDGQHRRPAGLPGRAHLVAGRHPRRRTGLRTRLCPGWRPGSRFNVAGEQLFSEGIEPPSAATRVRRCETCARHNKPAAATHNTQHTTHNTQHNVRKAVQTQAQHHDVHKDRNKGLDGHGQTCVPCDGHNVTCGRGGGGRHSAGT